MKGRPLDNMEFMQWFKAYWDSRLGSQHLNYDAVSRRSHAKSGAPKGAGLKPAGQAISRRPTEPQVGCTTLAPQLQMLYSPYSLNLCGLMLSCKAGTGLGLLPDAQLPARRFPAHRSVLAPTHSEPQHCGLFATGGINTAATSGVPQVCCKSLG